MAAPLKIQNRLYLCAGGFAANFVAASSIFPGLGKRTHSQSTHNEGPGNEEDQEKDPGTKRLRVSEDSEGEEFSQQKDLEELLEDLNQTRQIMLPAPRAPNTGSCVPIHPLEKSEKELPVEGFPCGYVFKAEKKDPNTGELVAAGIVIGSHHKVPLSWLPKPVEAMIDNARTVMGESSLQEILHEEGKL
jgi:hypothetical protein